MNKQSISYQNEIFKDEKNNLIMSRDIKKLNKIKIIT